MEKVYQITYMYEKRAEEYIDIHNPDLGIRVTTTFSERIELSYGKTPAKAIKAWKKEVKKRGDTKRVYLTEIKEYNVEQSSEN